MVEMTKLGGQVGRSWYMTNIVSKGVHVVTRMLVYTGRTDSHRIVVQVIRVQ
jgi:hypothetical protein